MPINLEAIWAGDRQAIRLAMGELTPQEMRTVLALLNMLRQEREDMRKQLRLYALDLLSVHEQDWGLHDDPTEVRFRKRIKQLEAQVETLTKEIRELKGNDADTRIGALLNEEQKQAIQYFIDDSDSYDRVGIKETKIAADLLKSILQK
jgi:hypothetical protein